MIPTEKNEKFKNTIPKQSLESSFSASFYGWSWVLGSPPLNRYGMEDIQTRGNTFECKYKM